jgi:hypothetical protein
MLGRERCNAQAREMPRLRRQRCNGRGARWRKDMVSSHLRNNELDRERQRCNALSYSALRRSQIAIFAVLF